MKERIKKNKVLYAVFHFLKGVFYWNLQWFYTLIFKISNSQIGRIIWRQDERYSRMEKYKDIHKGERCFIVATGPSLKMEDLERLKGEYTFSMNSVFLIYDKTDFRSTYYMIEDRTVMERLVDEYKIDLNQTNVFVGISNDGNWNGAGIGIRDVKNLSRVNLFHSDMAYALYYLFFQHDKYKPRFSFDCAKQIYDGTTVTYECVQLAAYMGFKEIYFVGVDCNFKGKKVHFVECNPNKDYASFADLAYLKQSRVYEYAHKTLKGKGVLLANATRGGQLESIPRVDLDSLLKQV